jgi:hypothetical protein
MAYMAKTRIVTPSTSTGRINSRRTIYAVMADSN